MLRIHGYAFAAAADGIATANSFAQNFASYGPTSEHNVDWLRKTVTDALNNAKSNLGELPLSGVFLGSFERLLRRISEADPNEISILIRELRINLIADLESSCFLVIDPHNREFYEIKTPPFGIEVQNKFPKAGLDIDAASRCYALDEWTACVFHLMRVVEHGLNWLAKAARVEPEKRGRKNWYEIIKSIDERLLELKKKRNTPKKVAFVQAASKAAAQASHFKDAWRNHVVHEGIGYDKNSGMAVWHAVNGFMRALSDPGFPSLPKGF
jgi:hypothetical protein